MYFLQVAGGCPPAFFIGVVLTELSVFVDESGDQGGQSKYYALTLVFHDQSNSLGNNLASHARGLRSRHLEDIPFHAGPLMTGHGKYEGMDFSMRKVYFQLFYLDVQHLPIKYQTFVYARRAFSDTDSLVARMRRDVIGLLFNNLGYFQSFDRVKIYYDNGQEIVVRALHTAVEYALSREAILYRKAEHSDFILAQAADLLCTLEVTAMKYRDNGQTKTDEKLFGSARSFKKNYMKAIRRKRLVRA